MRDVSDPSRPEGDGLVLDAEGLYRNVCRRVHRDGVVSDRERVLLSGLRDFLGIPADRARVLDQRARGEAARFQSMAESPLAREEVFRAACSLGWMDDRLEPPERELLRDLARVLRLEPEEARRIFDDVRAMHLRVTEPAGP